jgi:DDE superfamily endonuclease
LAGGAGLRWFRDRTSPDALARDHGISRATAYRYVDELLAVLADQAPDLRQALERAKDEGLAHVILDGKIIPCDRCKEPTLSVKGQVIDLWYSGKAHAHGGNIQAVLAPDGFPLWISDAEPGSVHDLTAARIHALPALYQAAAAKLPTLADPGYEGAGIGILIPVKQPPGGRELDIDTRTAMPSSGPCAALANAGSPCSTSAGAPSSTSPPAPAESAKLPALPSSSPISNTATSNEFH